MSEIISICYRETGVVKDILTASTSPAVVTDQQRLATLRPFGRPPNDQAREEAERHKQAAGPLVRCSRQECEFARHSSVLNNGGSHCCYRCKVGKGHGPLCEKRTMAPPEPAQASRPPKQTTPLAARVLPPVATQPANTTPSSSSWPTY